MRSFVTSVFALAVALAPAAVFAQSTSGTATTTQQPPAAAAPAAPATPAAPKLTFTTPGGLLLVQVKQDQTAAFEEMFAKIKANLAKAAAPELSGMANSWKIYKTAEGMQGNALYVVLVDPAVPGTEYSFLDVLNKTLTPDEQRAPETAEMYKKYAAAIAGLNKLNLTPVGGGQ
jgi:hypothetical protein